MTQLLLEDEVPVREIPQIADWSENYCFEAYDPKTDIGFFIHMGRWSLDTRLWREQVLLYLPGGEFMLHRSWGLRDISRGPHGALLNLTCREPGKAWTLDYHGPARKISAKEMHDAPHRDGPQSLLSLNVDYTSSFGPWDFGDEAKSEAWCSQHYEQPGRARGTIRFDGHEVNLDCVAFRDHSRGPRNLTTFAQHCWIHGIFPGERAFALFTTKAITPEGIVPKLAKVMVWDKGKMYPGTCDVLPYLASLEQPKTAYRFKIDSELGPMNIETKILRSLPLSTNIRQECFDGSTPDFAHILTYEEPSEFSWNGTVGHGHTERSIMFSEARR